MFWGTNLVNAALLLETYKFCGRLVCLSLEAVLDSIFNHDKITVIVLFLASPLPTVQSSAASQTSDNHGGDSDEERVDRGR